MEVSMNAIKNEQITNSLRLYNYLSIYGIDKFNTKQDIILISFMEDILKQNCYYDLLDECSFLAVEKFINYILHSNPQLAYCRIKLDDYKNLGNKQNIDTFKRLEGKTN